MPNFVFFANAVINKIGADPRVRVYHVPSAIISRTQLTPRPDPPYAWQKLPRARARKYLAT